MPATDVLRFATFNAAIRLQRHDLGLIAAGRKANLVIFDSLETLKAKAVYVSGRKIAENNQLINALNVPNDILPPRDTMRLSPITPNDCTLKIAGINNGSARLRHIRGARFTNGEKLTYKSRIAWYNCRIISVLFEFNTVTAVTMLYHK